jgi:hypothetical protein
MERWWIMIGRKEFSSMNKFIYLLVLLFTLTVCKAQQKITEPPDITFQYDGSMLVDFSAKTISVNYFQSPFPIHFTDKEENEITRSFLKNQIDEVKGDIICVNDTIAVIPSIDYKINLLIRGKVAASILVNYYYDPKYVRKHDSKYRAGNFVLDVTKILEHNADFKTALDSLRSYEKRNHIWKL